MVLENTFSFIELLIDDVLIANKIGSYLLDFFYIFNKS